MMSFSSNIVRTPLLSKQTVMKAVWTATIVVIALLGLANSIGLGYKNPMRTVKVANITLHQNSFNESYGGPDIPKEKYDKYCTEAREETFRAKADGEPMFGVFKLADGRHYNLLECPAKPHPVYVLTVDIFENEPLKYAYYAD